VTDSPAGSLAGVRFLGEDLVHGCGAGGDRGPDLVPVDGLGDRGSTMAHQVADVLDADAVGAEDGHERAISRAPSGRYTAGQVAALAVEHSRQPARSRVGHRLADLSLGGGLCTRRPRR
jgi:hypothetical protein